MNSDQLWHQLYIRLINHLEIQRLNQLEYNWHKHQLHEELNERLIIQSRDQLDRQFKKDFEK